MIDNNSRAWKLKGTEALSAVAESRRRTGSSEKKRKHTQYHQSDEEWTYPRAFFPSLNSDDSRKSLCH